MMHELVKNCYEKLNNFTYLDDINESSKIDKSGIYMITLDNIHSETLVPIYIGRSKNMQNRFKAHLKKLMALNRLRYQEYYDYFFNYKYLHGMSFYEGKFLYCKLFHTMIANNCSLDDFKMLVVEYCEPEKLEERELYYINYFSSQFLGFNQFHARTLWPQKDSRPEFYLQEVWSECQQLPIFLDHDFGYTRFNYYSVYAEKATHYQHLAKENKIHHLDFNLIEQLDETYCQDYIKNIKKIKNEYSAIDDSTSELESLLYNIREKVRKVIRKQIPRKRIEMDEQHSIINRFLLNETIVDLEQENIQGLRKQFTREMATYRHLKATYFQLEHLKETLREYLSSLKRQRHPLRYKHIFPEKEYPAFPLSHRKLLDPLSVTEQPNSLQLHFFTNKTGRDNYFIDAYIIYVKTIFRDKNSAISEKSYLIDSPLTRALQDELVYQEKHIIDRPLYSLPEPFKPVVENNDYITLGIEQRTGLNDNLFISAPLISLEDMFREFETIIDSDTMIAFTTPSGISRSVFLEGLDNTTGKIYYQLYDNYLRDYRRRNATGLPEKELRKTLLGNCYLFLQEHRYKQTKVLFYNKPKPIRVNKVVNHAKVKKKRDVVLQTRSPQEKAERELENQRKRRERYCNRLKTLTTSITVLNYQDSKTPVTYRCEHCSFEWSSRSDRILAKPVCRNCKR